ncbi:ATP-binding protein [Methanobrevibacter sp.]|uniref:ATP-binding protein n=1 Tax=Methanobrevibacter sp. TaxID=66852 RepID=UPI00388F9280
MLKKSELKRRDSYLNKLIAFRDTEPIKVITGIRRCGKSSLLKLMVNYLKDSGVDESQIIEMNFESFEFRRMTVEDFYFFVKGRVIANKKMYLFFDELQRLDGWEDAVNSFRVDFDCDIYITGSNAYLLSSEYSTYLSGRYVEIKMFPLSFQEFIDFYDFKMIEVNTLFGNMKKQIVDKNDVHYDLTEIFDAYMNFGGMPGISDVGLDIDKALIFLDGIYSTVVVRDILEREKRKGQKLITDPILLNKIILYLADNIGSNISVSTIGNILVNEGLLNDEGRKGTPSAHTVQSYVNALKESYFFYEIKRFDIKGKEYLRTLGKYYIVDVGLRNYLLGYRNRDLGHSLENIVFFELIRRGYDVAIGKVDNLEIDFIATKKDEKVYLQVTQSMVDENVKNRELHPLIKVNDNHEKIVLSLDVGTSNYEGIKIINIIDWLVSQ